MQIHDLTDVDTREVERARKCCSSVLLVKGSLITACACIVSTRCQAVLLSALYGSGGKLTSALHYQHRLKTV